MGTNSEISGLTIDLWHAKKSRSQFWWQHQRKKSDPSGFLIFCIDVQSSPDIESWRVRETENIMSTHSSSSISCSSSDSKNFGRALWTAALSEQDYSIRIRFHLFVFCSDQWAGNCLRRAWWTRHRVNRIGTFWVAYALSGNMNMKCAEKSR